MHIVYFLESINQQEKHYIGMTDNLTQRIQQHNQGCVISTKHSRPWKLIYAEAYANKQDAIGREKFLKSGSGWKFIKKQLFHYFKSKT